MEANKKAINERGWNKKEYIQVKYGGIIYSLSISTGQITRISDEC
jgi:hypothetical protein